MKLFLLLLAFVIFPYSAKADVWPTKNQWSPDWERSYEEWVKNKWVVDIFRNPESPYYGPFPDCADAVYAMRLIFAYENNLPFAANDPTGGKKLISNYMNKFDNVPEGIERMKAFMVYTFRVLGTSNLPSDTFPVAVNRGSIRPGDLVLALESRHVYMVKGIRDTGNPDLFHSSLGNRGNIRLRQSWPSSKYLFKAGMKQPSGIRDFRYPEDLQKPVWQVPGFSLEQYKFSQEAWITSIQKALAMRDESKLEIVSRQMHDTCEIVTFRIDLVKQATEINAENGDKCLSPADYDNLSTPSRDGQTKEGFLDLEKTYNDILQSNYPLTTDLTEQLQNIFASTKEAEAGADYCRIVYAPEKNLSLGEYRRHLFGGLVSHNPNDSLDVRWGEEKGPSAKAARCPTY